MSEVKVESFTVDHTKLNAPTIRVAKVIERGDVKIIKFDIRFIKPNTGFLLSDSIHSIEHLMAVAIREVLGDDVIDFSPMGCRTGFYLTMFGEDAESLKSSIIEAFNRALEEPLLATTPEECGNYRMHDEELAKSDIRKFLDGYGK